MPRKIDMDKTHAQKVINLFARLLFSDRKHSLTELSRFLNCSKQTVQRLIDNINTSYSVVIDEEFVGRKKYYSINKLPRNLPLLGLTESEYKTLQMCKAFAQHLLGDGFLEEATRALEKSSAYVPKPKRSKMDNFAVLRPGSIDYTPHHETIRLIIDAMDQKRICKIMYHSPGRVAPKTFFIMPLKLFSHNESLYLHARKATLPEKNEKAGYDPLLAVHRIIGVELTARNYEFPVDYDFEKVFNQEFGVIKDDPFLAEVHFTGFAAVYISERIWSPDQKIEKFDDESIKLVFKTSSIPETVSWILSFDQEATVIKPDWLKEKIKSLIDNMRLNYH